MCVVALTERPMYGLTTEARAAAAILRLRGLWMTAFEGHQMAQHTRRKPGRTAVSTTLLAVLAYACSGGSEIARTMDGAVRDAAISPDSGGDAAASRDSATDGPTARDSATDATDPVGHDASVEVPGWGVRTRSRLMLSGHSLTDNPLADFVEAIAAARGRDYDWEQQIGIGSPIRIRTRGSNAQSAEFVGYSSGKNRSGQNKDLLAEFVTPTTIGSGERYDTLVITERHDILDVIQWENTVPLLRHYHDRLRRQNDQSRTLLYQSWHNIDKGNPAHWIAYQQQELAAWECAASKVNLSLARDGHRQNVEVVPAGIALARLVEDALAGNVPGFSGTPRNILDAIFTDDVHISRAGAYLMAATVYAAVFGEAPNGGNLDGVASATARALETIAWQVVSAYYSRGTPWQHTMGECRTLLTALCPQYFAIRDRDARCTAWSDQNGPLSWPDTSIPLPEPAR